MARLGNGRLPGYLNPEKRYLLNRGADEGPSKRRFEELAGSTVADSHHIILQQRFRIFRVVQQDLQNIARMEQA